jgi:hypothetical protein
VLHLGCSLTKVTSIHNSNRAMRAHFNLIYDFLQQ